MKPRFRIVGVGASAGGLKAFMEFVKAIPAETNAAFVLVQHLEPNHKSLLEELLARVATLPVSEISDTTQLETRHIYVIPPNHKLSIEESRPVLRPRPKFGGSIHSIDYFLSSLAADQGRNAIGVILSGAGADGAQGIKAVRSRGGLTFAQDRTSAEYDSMPRHAVATGSIDFVLPPAEIAREISLLCAANCGDSRIGSEMRKDIADVGAAAERPPHLPLTTTDEVTFPFVRLQPATIALQDENKRLQAANEKLESSNREVVARNTELAAQNSVLVDSEERWREQAQRFERAPVLLRSTDDRIIFWSAGAEELYGFSKEEAVGCRSHLLLAANYSGTGAEIDDCLGQHGKWIGQVTHRRADGKELLVTVQCIVNAGSSPAARTVLEIHTDVSVMSARGNARQTLEHFRSL